MKKVCGVGVNDYDGKVMICGSIIKSYSVWRNMLVRCYDENFHKKQPSYIGCEVCEEWKSFSNFKKWFDENYNFELEEMGIDLCLDKDLFGCGILYSPSTCVFLPRKVNGFLANQRKNNKSGQIGVHWCKKRSVWQVNINDFYTSKTTFKGYFDCKNEAIKKYIHCREVESEKCKNMLNKLGYNLEVINKIK